MVAIIHSMNEAYLVDQSTLVCHAGIPAVYTLLKSRFDDEANENNTQVVLKAVNGNAALVDGL